MPEQCLCVESFVFPVILCFCNSKSGIPEVLFSFILFWEIYLISNTVSLQQRVHTGNFQGEENAN